MQNSGLAPNSTERSSQNWVSVMPSRASRRQRKRRAHGPPLILAEIELLRRAYRLHPFAEAGLVAASGVLVEDALLDALVHHGNRFAIGGLGGFLLTLGNGLSQSTQGAA